MKKKLISGLGTIIVIMIIAVFKLGGSTDSQCPFTVDIDGTAISLNEITVEELEKSGYDLLNAGIYEVPKEIDKKTYVDDAASINKDNMKYADISVANLSGSSEKISSCKVIEMKFYYADQFLMGKTVNTYKEASIDGFNPNGMTKDEVKAKVTKKITKDEDKTLKVEDGDYYCEYSFDDNGVVDHVEVGLPGYKVKTA